MGGAVDRLSGNGSGAIRRGIAYGTPDDGSRDGLAQVRLGALADVAQHERDELLGGIVAPIDGGTVEPRVSQRRLD